MEVVFIGSFNPVTKAHLMVAKEILKIPEVEKIIFVPVSDLYAKASLNTDGHHRLKMLELVCKKDMIVSDIELSLAQNLQRQPKTYETLTALGGDHQDLALLIGMDNYFDFPTWYKAEELLKRFKVMVYPRGNEQADVSLSPLYEPYHDRFIFIDALKISDISATKVRKLLHEQGNVKDLLDEKVIAYINEHKEELNYE